jgi:hypothetical protein
VTALCLLIAIAAGALWVRSHRTQDTIAWGGWYALDAAERDFAEYRGWLIAGKGELVLWRRTQRVEGLPPPQGHEFLQRDPYAGPAWRQTDIGPGNTYGPDVADTPLRKLGFFYDTRPGRSPTTRYTDAGLPLWSVAAAFALLPGVRFATWLRRRRGLRRRSPFACPGCGYDCRATPERCPECGAGAKAGRG